MIGCIPGREGGYFDNNDNGNNNHKDDDNGGTRTTSTSFFDTATNLRLDTFLEGRRGVISMTMTMTTTLPNNKL